MDSAEIFSHIDHTLLKADATWPQICRICREAEQYGAASACIPPGYIARAREEFPQLRLTTVIGFPLGYNTTAVKAFEAREAAAAGADELDMVVNISDLKNRAFLRVRYEIATLKEAVGDKILKVIGETCYLSEVEKEALCEAVALAGADYIKTSTGFGSAGATVADVRLFRTHLPEQVKIKAAGGIRTREFMEELLRAGADRLGCSAGVSALYPEEAK